MGAHVGVGAALLCSHTWPGLPHLLVMSHGMFQKLSKSEAGVLAYDVRRDAICPANHYLSSTKLCHPPNQRPWGRSLPGHAEAISTQERGHSPSLPPGVDSDVANKGILKKVLKAHQSPRSGWTLLPGS